MQHSRQKSDFTVITVAISGQYNTKSASVSPSSSVVKHKFKFKKLSERKLNVEKCVSVYGNGRPAVATAVGNADATPATQPLPHPNVDIAPLPLVPIKKTFHYNYY